MSDLIGKTSVTLSENWGSLKFYDYTFKVDGVPVPKDFPDLMVAVSEMRAVTVEREVTPMTDDQTIYSLQAAVSPTRRIRLPVFPREKRENGLF